jgi:hypothetical protein
MKISTAIVAHPKRRTMAHKLATSVNGYICMDNNDLGAKRNHLQAWECLWRTGADWGVVLEDDVELCDDFLYNLFKLLEHAPTPLVSLYLGRGRPIQYQERIGMAITHDVSYIVAEPLLSAQGYAMPVGFFNPKSANEVLAIDLPVDEAISKWAYQYHLRVSYPRYSLIDHRDGPSLIDDHGDGQARNGPTNLVFEDCDPSGAALPEVRKAWLMIAGHDIDWTLGSVEL